MAEEVIIIFRIPKHGVWKKSHNGNEVIIYLLEETLHCLGPNQYIFEAHVTVREMGMGQSQRAIKGLLRYENDEGIEKFSCATGFLLCKVLLLPVPVKIGFLLLF